jgi:hypothetical protein
MNRCNDRIILEFSAVGGAELIQMVTGKFEPAGERVAANDGGAERVLSHKGQVMVRGMKPEGRNSSPAMNLSIFLSRNISAKTSLSNCSFGIRPSFGPRP